MTFAAGDIVKAVQMITASGGLAATVPVDTEGVVTYVYPAGAMVSPWDGLEYNLKVRFPGHLNICKCLDGNYHVGEFEVTKVEVTDREIWDFFMGEEPDITEGK